MPNLKIEIMKKEEQKPSNPTIQQGWTLRDEFAANAMQSVIVGSAYDNYTGNNGLPVPEFVAKESYLIADAMLKQREL